MDGNHDRRHGGAVSPKSAPRGKLVARRKAENASVYTENVQVSLVSAVSVF
jgi:hypothetical protein